MHFVDKALTWQLGDRVGSWAWLGPLELAQAGHFAFKCLSISG